MQITMTVNGTEVTREVDDPAASDYLLLRDHLRADEADCRLYEATKRDLTRREWSDMNEYAEPDEVVTAAGTDQYFPRQYALQNPVFPQQPTSDQ